MFDVQQLIVVVTVVPSIGTKLVVEPLLKTIFDLTFGKKYSFVMHSPTHNGKQPLV